MIWRSVGLLPAAPRPSRSTSAALASSRVGVRVHHAGPLVARPAPRRCARSPARRVASRCQSSCCRRTSVISAAPCRSASARNAAPASIACSCSDRRPAPPWRRASRPRASTRSICREPIIPASSITSTSRAVEQLAALLPCMLQARERARRDAGAASRFFGRDARTAPRPARDSPRASQASRAAAQHRALAGAGIADDERQIAAALVVTCRSAASLLRPSAGRTRRSAARAAIALPAWPLRRSASRSCGRAPAAARSRSSRRVVNRSSPARPCQARTSSGDASHRASTAVELLLPVAVPVHEPRQVAVGERRLLLRDRRRARSPARR